MITISHQSSVDLWFTTARLSIRQSNRERDDAPSVIEHRMAYGFSPPQHVHHHEDETFYILEGTFRFQAGNEIFHLVAGDTIYCPRGMVHGFKVTSFEGARCLSITNGGFESMVRAASRPPSNDGLPEQIAPTPELQALLAKLCSAHGIELVGPPMA